MASCDGKRKRKHAKLDSTKKLLVSDKVEVRSLDDGFLGSWHSGVVVACENGARQVRYDHIVTDDTHEIIVERINVSPIIDGYSVHALSTSCPSRELIRPQPPIFNLNLKYGLCVDAFYNDAWWEGVIFDDKDGCDERCVFFPDLGDELKISINMLRVTLDWDRETDIWGHRGSWLFLQFIEEYQKVWPLCVSTKQIWYDVRMEKDGDWTSSTSVVLWKCLILKVMKDYFYLTVNELWDLSQISVEISRSMEHVQRCDSMHRIQKYPKKRKTVGGSKSISVLRSLKKTTQVAIRKSKSIPQTVLSSLIDNNVVLSRSKVHYRSPKNNLRITEGWIIRDGIKCNCCLQVFSVSGFQAHAGSTNRRPSANIFLDDGRSLLECKKQLVKRNISETCSSTRHRGGRYENDYICSVCHYGGDLILCDRCPSSFHMSCLGLEVIPDGIWVCPSCCCRICSHGIPNITTDHNGDSSFAVCAQCNHQFHVRCLREKGFARYKINFKKKWFCSKICKKISMKLHKLSGKSVRVSLGLTWTLLKSADYDCFNFDGNDESKIEDQCKLNVAFAVLHECFKSIREPHSSTDLVHNVIFSRGSHLNRLDFKGFYTIILERNDELVSVATVRVHGKNVAEVPLVGTRVKYRRLGMCGILLNELQKKLTKIGVERLVLPAIPSVLNTWTGSFGFKRMTHPERLELLDCTFLDFPDTVLCQKFLTKPPLIESLDVKKHCVGVETDAHLPVSEVSQAEEIDESKLTGEHLMWIIFGAKCNDCEIEADVVDPTKTCDREESEILRIPDSVSEERSFGLTDADHFVEDANHPRNHIHNINFECHKRQKIVATGA